MSKFNIAVIVGSNRRESLNRRLAEALVKLGQAEFAASIVRIDDLPLYNQDLEADLPESVQRFKAELAHDENGPFVADARQHLADPPAILGHMQVTR